MTLTLFFFHMWKQNSMYLYISLYLSVCTLTRYNLFLSFIRKYNHFFYKALSEFDSSCWTEWEEKSDNQKVYFIVPNSRVIWEYLRCPWGFLAIRLIELFLDWSLSHCRSHDPRCPVKMLMTCSAFPSDTGYVCQKGVTACWDILNIVKPNRCCGCVVVSLASL